MQEVDLHFVPAVPVFDANLALGRRHDRRVFADTPAQALAEMDRVGVGRALAYCQHAVLFDARDGNAMLIEMVGGEPRLIPQFVVNPAHDNLAALAADAGEHGVRSLRIAPIPHSYPLQEWVVGELLDWASERQIPLWVSAFDVDPSQLHDTLAARPGVTVVLAEPHYRHMPWIVPLLRSSPNLHVELSRAVIVDAIPRLLAAAGHERLMYGSWWPEGPMGAQLYALHRCGLTENQLRAVCAGNLERLLGGEGR